MVPGLTNRTTEHNKVQKQTHVLIALQLRGKRLFFLPLLDSMG